MILRIIKKILLAIVIIVISIFTLLWIGAIVFTKMDTKDYYYKEPKISNTDRSKNTIPYYLNESFDIYRRRNIDTQDEWTKFTLKHDEFYNYADTLKAINEYDLNNEIYGLYNSWLPLTNDIPSWWPKDLRDKGILKNAISNEYILGKYFYRLTDEIGYYRYCFLYPADTTVYWFTYRVKKNDNGVFQISY